MLHSWIQAALLGLVEGLTEFVPVSSTGHLILAGHWLGFTGAKADTFEIFIQLGAILAVLVAFPNRFTGLFKSDADGKFQGKRSWLLLGLTSAPALVAGLLLHKVIKTHLFNPLTVAIGLGVGGLLMLIGERVFRKPSRLSLDQIGPLQALAIGCSQCLALWPGMSRSSSTILGGMLFGLDRRTAAEYSFLAAVPIISAASIYDLWKSRDLLAFADFMPFTIGFLVSFVVGWLSIRILLRFLATHRLDGFGYYRIGMALLAYMVFRNQGFAQ